MNHKCAGCDKKFYKKDEVVVTNAMGIKDLVHIECLHDYVLRASTQEYYDTFEDYLIENEQ